MDAMSEVQAEILVLCMQARAYSRLLADTREKADELLTAMRRTLAMLAKWDDPRVQAVVTEANKLIDTTRAGLLRVLN